MNEVLLKDDGLLADTGLKPVTDPLGVLGARVTLAEDFSLRGFFRLVERYPVLIRISVFFPSLLDQYKACAPEGCRTDGFEHLQFAKTVEMIGFPGQPRLEIYNCLRGVYKAEVVELKYFALETLLDMPLRLGSLRHVVFGDKMDVFQFDTVYTLFEFLDGIAWELSFHSIPKDCQIRR